MHIYLQRSQICTLLWYSQYSQTCFSDHLSTKTTFFVSLENGFSLNHVLKEPVHKDHLPTKTTFLVSLGWSLQTGFTEYDINEFTLTCAAFKLSASSCRLVAGKKTMLSMVCINSNWTTHLMSRDVNSLWSAAVSGKRKTDMKYINQYLYMIHPPHPHHHHIYINGFVYSKSSRSPKAELFDILRIDKNIKIQ